MISFTEEDSSASVTFFSMNTLVVVKVYGQPGNHSAAAALAPAP